MPLPEHPADRTIDDLARQLAAARARLAARQAALVRAALTADPSAVTVTVTATATAAAAEIPADALARLRAVLAHKAR
jgi:hypothetical protein